jgi:hypothetical protein
MQRKKFLATAGATTAALAAPRFTLAAGPARCSRWKTRTAAAG